MSNIVNFIESGLAVTMNAKGKTGSMALAIAFASREVRQNQGMSLYIKWLENGQFRPLANDILTRLVPKAAMPFMEGLIPANGPVSKAQFVTLCQQVHSAWDVKIREGKAPKGEKAFVYGIVDRIVRGNSHTEVAAEISEAA